MTEREKKLNEERRKRYCEKKYITAKIITCACGCKHTLKEFDRHGRKHCYINGHNGRKYENKKQHKKEWIKRNKQSVYSVRLKWGHKRKATLIQLKGNKCGKCQIEYNGKNAAIFQFHHINPELKKFAICSNLINYAWKTILVEVEKCELLCANCHALHHSGER